MRTKREQRRQPGEVRDAIVAFLKSKSAPASVKEIAAGVSTQIGDVPLSSVRSYLNLNTPGRFRRVARGEYVLTGGQ